MLIFVSAAVFLPAVQAMSKGGGGEGIPVPLTTNQKVELADGEYYLLVGRVSFFDSHPYLSVDLNIHPWLASSYRRFEPYYPLEETSSCWWKRYEGRRVKVLVRAVGKVDSGDQLHPPSYSLWLSPLDEPIPMSSRRGGIL